MNQSPLQLNNFLPYRLYVLANRISRSLADHYEQQFQITRPEWRIIAVLGEQPDLSAAQVAELTAMDKVATSRAVTKLLASKLLIRSFAVDDKRRSQLSLSAKGQKLYQKIVPIAQAYEEKIVSQLSDHERELLRTLLEKLDHLELDF
ncbi:MarR family winged helix-turn-helix transcriptional regulator [Aestuariirhabdus sp. Z084]|uniref:MarR family winged helix-turn-helix transcriptional regulator n=1 Tax=Aestuariirhabdus haliotis TaxID=2918751 RepID=UPI00201B3FCE|nr:MarR family winged helix-turn-helix transcriptional regulator [Aestuariirhabdus haliotis]MCL6415671.1 MarR family winged helix-turn-helix transcriptional regulator [Aestuariirhabdus haliotis]MCL6419803.1 MarR family winged helix-turn-helix transcriptional regulator [Aestuariirhabdus haliotis]